MLTKLSWNNINWLQEDCNQLDGQFPISFINFYTWKFYNSHFYFIKKDNAIYLYIFEFENNDPNFKPLSISVFAPIVKDKNAVNLIKHYKDAIYAIKDFLVKDKNISIDICSFDLKDLKLFKNAQTVFTFNCGYIYETNQLKYMSGKKMQKKRNFLNYYNKNFAKDSQVFKYDSSWKQKIIEFCKKYCIDENTNQIRTNEIQVIQDFLNSETKGLGTILLYKDNIIGFTYGFVCKDKYEIFFEKADKNFKGSFQYLITQNLLINEINTKYVDRQDDINSENLKKSKLSYKPIDVIKLYFFKP